MGDLRVRRVRVLPECLERGVWPSEEQYTLSDHGMVEVVFEGEVLGSESE
jgi:hypothetical protein